MKLSEFNNAGSAEASKMLSSCCAAAAWVKLMMQGLPFKDEADMVSKAVVAWYEKCGDSDWLEAFTHHPKIGDLKSLTEKFAGKEQAAVGTASGEILTALADANAAYEKKFGFIFIVCATGKSAAEMLRLLNDRLRNSRNEELQIAMGEQHKISIIRFKKLLDDANWQAFSTSHITTHVLNTSTGIPGRDITIRLKKCVEGNWQTMAMGVTNNDGRIADLLPPGRWIPAGNYIMTFETGDYYNRNDVKGFYPMVDIQFTVFDTSHYHIPLLINPFGYSTYRGS